MYARMFDVGLPVTAALHKKSSIAEQFNRSVSLQNRER
jgi:hypothetical protein